MLGASIYRIVDHRRHLVAGRTLKYGMLMPVLVDCGALLPNEVIWVIWLVMHASFVICPSLLHPPRAMSDPLHEICIRVQRLERNVS